MKIKKVLIPATEQVESHTVYYLEVYTREYSWVVDRRYREFYELHEKLVKNHGLDHCLIPPKKYFGFLQPEYVEKRRQALEAYFEMLLSKFEDKLPQEVLTFLDTDKFDVCGVTHSLAKELFTTGDEILTKGQQFTLTPLQVHCITSRLGMAAPTCDSHIPHGEIGNLYDFLYQLKHLKVCGGKKLVELSDNITLKCNIAIFKSLTTLEIDSCEVEPFEGLSVVQAQISKLTVHQSVHLLKDILVDDEIWEQGVLETVDVDGNTSLSPQSNFRAWTALTEADFSSNDLPYIDESVTLLPEVVSLNLSYNSIEYIEHLQALSNLVELDLSHNKIASLGSNLNTKLGNIKKLDLAGNELDSVQGLDKLYSLTALNLRENNFSDIGSILTLGELPCLEYIDFRDNAVTKGPMYRIRVFTAFDDRAEQVELDGNRPTSREMNRIRELLQEEQNFEIINYPTPPQYSVPKKGHKKGKSVDRVISLNDVTEFQSSSSVTDSTNSFVDDTDQEFRSKVEKIRQIGGDSWLKILDEMQGEAEMTQVRGSDQVHSGNEKSPSEPVSYPQSSKVDTISGGSASPPTHWEEQETSDEPMEDDHPRRLQFGFAPELEKLIHEKVESSADLTSGTYMVEVEGEERNKGDAEERMVGVDLDKGLILEIKISTGETFARHRLEDISSVDILQLHGVFYVDIRDIFSKEWRRHRDSLTSGHNKDYQQVAQYRMRSVDDAAELFALLYKFITERSSKESIPSISVQEPLDDVFSGNVVEWPNPLGVQDKLLHRFFDKFLHKRDSRADVDKQARQVTKDLILEGRSTKRTQTIYQALHAEFIDVGCLRHDRSWTYPERVRLVLWSGCLPYVCPERELPICLLMTNVNIYLFHSSHLDCPERVRAVTKASDLRQILQCFYSFPVRHFRTSLTSALAAAAQLLVEMSLAFIQPGNTQILRPKSGFALAAQAPPSPADAAKSTSLLAGAACGAVAACASRPRQQKVQRKARKESRTRTVNPATNEPEDPQDFPKPSCISETDNYRESTALTKKLMALKGKGESKTVAIIGGGLSGLSCAKYLVDAGHKPIVLEARDCLGGKVSAWKDKDGDWIETGLHIFFGAYPNMMNIFSELDIEDRLQWKRHQMIFAMQELPGEFTTFDFLEGIPAPFNFALSILLNQKMLTLPEKLQTAPALLPMLVEGQKFIDLQDELSVFNFMEKYGMPDRINTEVFIAMAKALDFIDPEKLSMTVVLTAMNRFLNETDGLQMAFIDGNQTERLCEPMKQYIEERGGQVLLNQPLASIETNEDGSVKCFKMRDGKEIVADEYVSSVPCDIMKRILPRAWSTDPFFRQIDELEGIPVINIHLWFDRKLLNVNHLCFSRSPLLSVYADMSTCCKEYEDEDKSMLELVFAPCSPIAGGGVNWMGKSDEEIVAATMKELERLFPTEIGEDLPDGGAKLLKHAVVKVPRSVYAAVPGRNKFRPSQETPIKNFTLAGDWTSQKFLGSMEGAIFAGKLAAEVVACKAAGEPTKGLKEIDASILAKKDSFVPEDPMGVKGKTPIAFGGGEVLGSGFESKLRDQEAILLEA